MLCRCWRCRPALSALITLDAPRAPSARAAEHAIALPVEASLALPLLVTSLAQRIPGTRQRTQPAEPTPVEPVAREEPALA